LRLLQHDDHQYINGGGRRKHRPERPEAGLTGSGSTFDAPFFAVAFAKYQQLHPSVTITYYLSTVSAAWVAKVGQRRSSRSAQCRVCG